MAGSFVAYFDVAFDYRYIYVYVVLFVIYSREFVYQVCSGGIGADQRNLCATGFQALTLCVEAGYVSGCTVNYALLISELVIMLGRVSEGVDVL